MMQQYGDSRHLPPLPDYTLSPLPPLIDPIPDKVLTVLLPVAAYWTLSMLFHWIDVNDYFSQYRLHTPAEVLKRNHVSRWEVVRDVVIQQVIQTVVGVLLGMTEPDDYHGKEEYDVTVWARRIRIMQRAVPAILAAIGINSTGLANNVADSYPALAGVVSGGVYPYPNPMKILLSDTEALAPAFAQWEMVMAKAIYWIAVPAIQFGFAIVIVDTWQYFLHRAMHMNRWLYSKSWHKEEATRANMYSSNIPFPTSSPVCSLCFRRSVQSPV